MNFSIIKFLQILWVWKNFTKDKSENFSSDLVCVKI